MENAKENRIEMGMFLGIKIEALEAFFEMLTTTFLQKNQDDLLPHLKVGKELVASISNDLDRLNRLFLEHLGVIDVKIEKNGSGKEEIGGLVFETTVRQ